VRPRAHHEDLVVGSLEREQHGVPLPHREQAAAAVGQEPDVEQIERLADPAQRHRRYPVRVLDRGQFGGHHGMSWLALRRDAGANAALRRHLATGFRLVTTGRSGTP
jgi:hypothetical protein